MCGNDQKALFGIVKDLMSHCGQDRPTAGLANQADDFNQFFLKKISKIHDLLSKNETQECIDEATCMTSFHCFSSVTEQEVTRVITKSPSKSSPLDPWPTWLVKTHLTTLAPTLTAIVNLSLSSGIFPLEWKRALVTPLLKKQSLDPQSLSNYRPVSNLPFISKVVEQVVAKQITSYLQENNLYPQFQSAYRANHSVETALLRVQNDILQAIDNQQGVVLVLLDLSAAFDTIFHDILLHRLKHRFGMSGKVLEWITSYLSKRSQTVNHGGKISEPSPVPHGVPQGSVLGPILFSLYTSPIGDIIDHHHIQYMLYADDTQLYLAFKFKNNPSIHTTMTSVQLCIADVGKWMSTNKLKLNGDKTEMMILTTPRL